MSDDMPLPGPPDHYDEAERKAWLKGAAHTAEVLATQNRIIAGSYDEAAGTNDTDEEDQGPTCPECGSDAMEGLGGTICPECDL